jgi:hypothetical protein
VFITCPSSSEFLRRITVIISTGKCQDLNPNSCNSDTGEGWSEAERGRETPGAGLGKAFWRGEGRTIMWRHFSQDK